MSDGWRIRLPWGPNPNGSFNWAYDHQSWLDKYQATSVTNFKRLVAAYETLVGP